VLVSGVEIDPEWLTAYAKTAVKGADQLSAVSAGDPLGNEAFGELGRRIRTAEAYQRAATCLREQLTRAVETLHSASDSLNEVVSRYQTSEHDNVRSIKRADRL
jgi:hypothetical protein